MFGNLSGSIQDVLRKLRGQATLSESNIRETMAEVRTALIDADVNHEVADEFVADVSKDCLGEAVLRSVSPGQMAVKVVHDRLVELMGGAAVPLATGSFPNVVMLVGLHGSGKTTSCAKLASFIRKGGKRVMMAACDIYRPAAIDQLEFLGKELGIPVHSARGESALSIATSAMAQARSGGFDYLLIDTAGRLQIDVPMVQELVQISQATRAKETLLVADAALGQQAVSVSKHFHEALGLTGVMLTKLDGDARGGAALSIRKVVGCPIKFIGTGEKVADFETFHPDRMASRILGMGDIVSLVEKASDELDQEETERLQAKLKKSQFDFDDFLGQLRQISKMGGVESILRMLPGGDRLLGKQEFDTSQLKSTEAIIQSMTKRERANPDLIDFQRRKRIAKGSGCSLEQVGQLIKQFTMMRKMMKGSGLNRMMEGLPGGASPGFRPSGGGTNRMPPKKKRKKRR